MSALAHAIARSFSVAEPDRPAVSPLRALGRRRLSGIEVLAQSAATTAPAASMVALPVAMLQTGDLFTGLLTVAAAAVLIMLVALCVTQFTRRQAAAGGLHSFAFQGLGTPAALATGVAILVKFLGSAALTLYSGSRAVTLLLAHLGVDAGGWIGHALVSALVAAVVIVVLVRGVRVGAIAILAVELCSLLFIVGLSVLPAAGVVAPPPQPVGTAHGVLYLALATIFSLAGFESATFFGPEARRPMVTVTRTVLLTPMLCGALFVLSAWAAWTGHSATLINAYLYGTAAGVPAPLVVALELGVCCSWLASATASSHAASRLVYSLGVERLLPARLARVHARFRTPHAAIATIVAAVAAGALALAGGDVLDDALRHVVRAMVVAAYALVAAASVRFLLRIREQTVPVLVAGAVGAVACVVLLGYLVVAVVLDGRIGTAAVIVALLAVGPLWQRHLRRRPARLDAVGAFDCAESADVLPGAGAFAADAAGNVVLVRRGRTS
ncbi:APC family permease [Pseudonocardia cypriaca]|uniref:Amino acid/polyamine/organocation transporter (APC superfamily) n=1 Tax=Pseudonocardia cypriaca TaxID=882449 RepID=A0A543FWA0_9PSEU|nr:APC family permease [Pseudonocardia cypriaca]TQM38110.1 amino acid/polyamine/organocation transporter (APC superfamily) [Pseudonocardia cypriaca]